MPATSSFLQSFLEPLLGRWLYADSPLWTVVGFLGAAIFGCRFLLQWLHSEKEKKLVVPWYFWHLSFWGSMLNFLYFLHLDKAPLILGNFFLPIVYGRSIFFLRAGGEKGRGRFVFAGVAVLVLVGFAASAYMAGDRKADPQALLEAQLTAFDSAAKAYAEDFGAFPTGDSKTVVGALMGDNAQKKRFLTSSVLSSEGLWLDPWGHAYRIHSAGNALLIRSAGPNGTFDNGVTEKRDDILAEIAVK
ncbi:MAG: lipid-A-disaccharide synthase N-terminal domain-containing protein [Roseimicrobium sp.]